MARQFYEANPQMFSDVPELAHILVESEAEAKHILTLLNEGRAFSDLAAQYSKCPSGQNGGQLGRVPGFMYVSEFAEALPSLREVGQVTGPVRSRYGFHLIRLSGERRTVALSECEEILGQWLAHTGKMAAPEKPAYPRTKKVDFSEEVGGYQNQDPYVWLEDLHAPEVKAWVAEQNRFTDGYFDSDRVRQRAEELKGKYPKRDYALPKTREGKIYTVRTDEAGNTTPVILDSDWRELREVGAELKDRYTLYDITPSPVDGDLVSLSAAPHGAHLPSTLVYDLRENKVLYCAEEGLGAVWSSDGALWYAQSLPHREEGYNDNPVWRWTPEGGAVKIYDAPKDRAYVTLSSGENGQVMINSKYDFGANELLRADAAGHVVSLTGDIRARNDYCGTHDGVHYILTEDGAPLGKVVAGGRTVIPESDRMLTGAVVTKRGLLAAFMEHACLRLELYDFSGKLLEEIPLPDRYGAMSSRGSGMPAPCEGAVYFTFESFTLPPAIYAWNEADGSLERVFCASGDVVPEDIVTEEVFVTARDGVKVPAFIVHKKDVRLDGENPVLMYGYGGYNLSMPPSYTNLFIGMPPWEWVQKGGVYVNCNLRGGNEYGAAWHEAGMLKNKKNAFNDFIDIAEWLIANKWTKAGRIAICGGSNGGLLMTALTTMRPDLWGAVIASVPHTDMLRFVNDPAGPRYITEYGNPRDPDMLPYMLSYSPYHNVWERYYPPIYVQTGERDNNVPPYHGKKFAAKMQERSQGEIVLLRVLAEGAHDRGHGDVMFQTTAEMQLFIEQHLGI